MEEILLLDDTLRVVVYYDPEDSNYADNICICMEEDCPEDERILRADQINVYLTRDQARRLAEALLKAAERSWEDSDAGN